MTKCVVIYWAWPFGVCTSAGPRHRQDIPGTEAHPWRFTPLFFVRYRATARCLLYSARLKAELLIVIAAIAARVPSSRKDCEKRGIIDVE